MLGRRLRFSHPPSPPPSQVCVGGGCSKGLGHLQRKHICESLFDSNLFWNLFFPFSGVGENGPRRGCGSTRLRDSCWVSGCAETHSRLVEETQPTSEWREVKLAQFANPDLEVRGNHGGRGEPWLEGGLWPLTHLAEDGARFPVCLTHSCVGRRPERNYHLVAEGSNIFCLGARIKHFNG